MKLRKAERDVPEWQTAGEILIGAAEGRNFIMHARIGMLRALNRNVERTFSPNRKDTHWGKRNLKRTSDQTPGQARARHHQPIIECDHRRQQT